MLVTNTEFIEEEKHIAAVQKAMEKGGMLDHTIVHGVFVGPARSGKNSLMQRLLGRMPLTPCPSTGVAESVVQVKVIQKSATIAANVEESTWSIMDYDDEVIKLMLINSESQDKAEVPDAVLKTEKVNIINDSNDNDKCKNDLTTDHESDDEWFDAQSSLSEGQPNLPLKKTSPVQPHTQLPDSYVPPAEIFKAALRKKGSNVLQQHFQKTWSLYLTNTGGQMEFQEVLPLLVSGPSIFFITFRLDRDLNKHYVIEYELSDGRKAEPYKSSLTAVEGILQTLATIAAMGTFAYKGLQKRKVPRRPKVFFVGTHRDQLDSKTADGDIEKIDHQLQEIIMSTSHYRSLIEYASPSRLIFAVNNFSVSDKDFKDIRSAVEQVIVRDEFQMTSPARWLIFSLALRSLTRYVVSYDDCFQMARKCGLDEDEFVEALHFIHSKMGLIRYFPYKDVKDLVVIHPQFLFDKVTELIVDTFTFEKAGKCTMDEFRHKGIFSFLDFENISSRNNGCIRPFQFAKLLERLRIAAPFQMDGNRMYFFPCVLAHTKVTGLCRLDFASVGPHLMVVFKCGYCPKGLAGALIKYLMANEMRSPLTWELHYDKIFRNQVSFKVGPLDSIVLKISSTHLEIIFFPNEEFHNRFVACPMSSVCSAVREAVEAGITQVTSDINYVNAEHSLTFPCVCQHCKGSHPGVLNYMNGVPYCLTCSKTNKPFQLPAGHELWQICNNTTYQSQAPYDLKQSHTSSRLTEEHHSVLLKQLTKHSSDWKEIGIHLGFNQAELSNIQDRPLLLSKAPTTWLSAMLVEWLQWAPGDSRGSTSFATLEGLKAALREGGLGATAYDLSAQIHH